MENRSDPILSSSNVAPGRARVSRGMNQMMMRTYIALLFPFLVLLAGCEIKIPTKQGVVLDSNVAPAKNRIVFVSNRDGSPNIYSIDAKDNREQKLTDTQAEDSEPCWSPDGRHIAFSRKVNRIAEIFVINADGSGLQQLTRHRSISDGPVWSPDGKYIAYYTWARDNWEIFVIAVDTGVYRNVTNSPGTDTYPHWSPDGKQIVFHCQQKDGDWNIYVMGRNGSHRRCLTTNPSEDWLPTWSPDGTKIAFWSTRRGNWELFLMNPDGSDPQQISNENGRVHYAISRAAWSPDGKSLAIATFLEPGNMEIARINKDDGSLERLTSSQGVDADPDWSR